MWMHFFVTFITAILIDLMNLFFFPFCSLRPGYQALQFSTQWPEIKLQTLRDTHLLPSIILALFHLFLCFRQVRLLAFISPNSSTTTSYLSLFMPTPTPLSPSWPLFTQNAKHFHSDPSSGGDLGFLNWNWRQIKNHWPPLNPNTHPYSLPIPLKLHSNDLNGAFPLELGSSWRFMTQVKVICKPLASIMKFHLATENTAQLAQHFNQIYSPKFLCHNHEDKFSAHCHIHQTGKIIRLLQSVANRQGQIKWYLLWHAAFPTDSFAVWQQNRNIKMHKSTQRVQTHFLNSSVKNTALSLWNRKSQSLSLPSPSAPWSVCNWSRWYYFIMTEPIFYNYQELSALPAWIRIVSWALVLFSHSDANL